MSDFYTQLAEAWGVERGQAREMWNKALSIGAVDHPSVTRTNFQKVAAFQRKFGLGYEGKPRELDDDLAVFRIAFMLEELAEYCTASGFAMIGATLEKITEIIKDKKINMAIVERSGERDFHGQLDALVDLAYVLYGTAYMQGLDIDGAYEVVHQANMKKVRVERAEESKRGSTFDVVKPESWTPPDLKDFLK